MGWQEDEELPVPRICAGVPYNRTRPALVHFTSFLSIAVDRYRTNKNLT